MAADALRANSAADSRTAAADRYQVVVHVDAEALRAGSDSGESALAGGAHVSAETSRRLACDGARSVMIHDAAGNTIAVGARRRTVPSAIRRALDYRDRGCRFPGCDLRRCDAHHVQHWADGGATRLDNLVLLCRRHHRAVHEEGYAVQLAAGGEARCRRPDGRELPQVPSPPTATGARDAVAAVAPEPWEPAGRQTLDVAYALLTLRAEAGGP